MIRSKQLRALIPANFALLFSSVSHLCPVTELGWIYTQWSRGWEALHSIPASSFPAESPEQVRLALLGIRGAAERQINVISVPDQGGAGLFPCPDAAPTRAALQPQPGGC